MTDSTRPRREPPGPLGRRLARAPIWLYRAGLGPLLGRRFVMIEHIGRKSGLVRRTVLEVVDRDGPIIRVAAAWPTSDWLRNLRANPQVTVSSGSIRRQPYRATVLDHAAAARVFAAYSEHHPRAAGALARTLGLPFDDPAAMATSVPAVELVPASEGSHSHTAPVG